MKLSQETIAILNSYKGINSNLRVFPGKKLETVSTSGSFLASYQTQEEFPDFSIHDLSELLNLLSLYKEPDVVFEEGYLTITEGRRKTKYVYGDPATFKRKLNERPVVMPDAEIKFDLSLEDLSVVLKAAGALKFNTISITKNSDNKILIQAEDAKLDSSNSFSIDIDSATDISNLDFSFAFDIGNLRLVSGNYFVEVSSKQIARFTNKDIPLVYFATAIKKESRFSNDGI